MDAATPNGVGTAEIPVALSLLATTIAAQVDLGIGIQRAHEEEVRLHSRTRLHLDRMADDRERLRKFNLDLLSQIDRIRKAVNGEEEPTKTGDALAEVRELWAKSYNLERELLEAKALLESAPAQNATWEKARRDWQGRVSQILGLPTNPDSDEDPVFGIEPEEPHGESHS